MKKPSGDELLNTNYPFISDDLIRVLRRDFPNELPRKEISPFELGKLIGHIEVIEKLITEQQINEGKDFRDDLEEV